MILGVPLVEAPDQIDEAREILGACSDQDRVGRGDRYDLDRGLRECGWGVKVRVRAAALEEEALARGALGGVEHLTQGRR